MVSLIFSSLPFTTRTSPPIFSIRAQSSVNSRLFSPAFSRANIYKSLSKTCGVCTALSCERSGVLSILLNPSTILIVSVTDVPRVAAPVSKAASTTLSISSTVISGRAPSWIAKYFAFSFAALMPLRTLAEREEPPSTTLLTFVNPFWFTSSLMRSTSCSRQTITISFIR